MKKDYDFQRLGDAPIVGEMQKNDTGERIETTECPRCACIQSTVRETRQIEFNGHRSIVRVRTCRHCKKNFRTREIVDENIRLKNRPTAQGTEPDSKFLDVGMKNKPASPFD